MPAHSRPFLCSMAFFAALLIALLGTGRASGQTRYLVTDVSPGSGESGYSYAINQSGQVVGNTYGWGARPFLWENGVFSDISPSPWFAGQARCVNDLGEAGGFYLDTAGYYYSCALNLGGSPTNYQGFGPYGIAESINNNHQLVGYIWDDTGAWGGNGFRYDATTRSFTVLSGSAYGINDNGDIVGSDWSASRNSTHATLWSNAHRRTLAR